jgi:hypothetical protein
MEQFRTKLRSVRFKNGGHIHLLDDPMEKVSEEVMASYQDGGYSNLGGHGKKLAGFALVSWTVDNEYGVSTHISRRSPIIGAQVPAFCKDAITGFMITKGLW